MWSTYAFSTKLIEYKFSIIYNYPSKIYTIFIFIKKLIEV